MRGTEESCYHSAVERALAEVSVGGTGSREKKPTLSGWAQEALQRTWPRVGSEGPGGFIRAEGVFTQKEQEVTGPGEGEREAREPMASLGGRGSSSH